ncbi:uncharacterized protein ACJ7VT_003376 [Polymixia lowei]
MSRRKEFVTGGNNRIPRIRENSRLMRAHESMVDLISRRPSQNSFLDTFSSSLFGFDYHIWSAIEANLQNDVVYSDSDEEEEFYPSWSHNAPQRPLAPHPQIRQLTQEEADKHAKELLEEEEKRKERTERNKRKKQRKKEKKRLEKENAVKDDLPEEETAKSETSENHEEKIIIESNVETKKPTVPVSGETQNQTVVPGPDDNSDDNNDNDDEFVEMNKEGNLEPKDLDIKNSFISSSVSAAKEKPDHTPKTEKKNETKSVLSVVQPPEEKKSEVLEDADVQKKKGNQKEKKVEANVEDFTKRSAELARVGNRLAACRQFEMAIKCFTDAIKYNPKEFKLFGNRSLCYERIQQYEKALLDADLALSMEPNWIKGLFRKGKALCGLKRYYEASLIYREVLRRESTSTEAVMELKRAQTLHLMEMGFTWAQSSDTLKQHATLEEAVEALFGGEGTQGCADGNPSRDNTNQPMEEEGADDEEGEWVLPSNRTRVQHVKLAGAVGRTRPKSQSPTPHPRNTGKPELFPIWVGSLAPTVTQITLYDLFSRAGHVYSIKMLLEHQCAFVHYTRKEDCDRAIQLINGMVVEGAPLSVRYPNKIHPELGVSKSAATDACLLPVTATSGKNLKGECFFWRTTGCTKQEKCIYRHVPEHKHIDKDKIKQWPAN